MTTPKTPAITGRLDPPLPKAVIKFFDRSRKGVFARRELADVIGEHRMEWRVPPSWNISEIVQRLIVQCRMQKIALRPESRPIRDKGEAYAPITRYVWGTVSPYTIGLSLRSGAYLSHGSAAFLHGISNIVPRIVYVNREQSPKPHPESLTQKGIDRAFAANPRTSRYAFTHGDYRFLLLSGKFTNRLEVETLEGPGGEPLDATTLDRTLIDMTVRPMYAGGVVEVLRAYETARDRASVGAVTSILKKLDYAYPYHQAIGFYMQRAGYESKKLAQLKTLGLNYDFYLTNRMVKPKYDKEWRLFYPQAF